MDFKRIHANTCYHEQYPDQEKIVVCTKNVRLMGLVALDN
jgi:hypothetical protein